MSVNLTEFLLKELVFYPFLVHECTEEEEGQAYIFTDSLIPFLRNKQEPEIYILENLLGHKSLWNFNFDNSKLFFSEKFFSILEARGSILEKTLYFETFSQEITDCDQEITELTQEIYLHKRKDVNYGFMVLKDASSKQKFLLENSKSVKFPKLLEFSEFLDRISEYKHNQTQLFKDKLNYTNAMHSSSNSVCKFTNVHSKTNVETLKRLFSLISPVEYVIFTSHALERTGIVKFRSEFGQKLAIEYFNREFIVQKGPKDLGSLLNMKEYTGNERKITLDKVMMDELQHSSGECPDKSVKRKLEQEFTRNKHIRFT